MLPEIKEPLLIGSHSKNQPAIQVTNLKKSFSWKNSNPLTVLNGISFSVLAGEIVGIFGPSGCGKTTLLRILSGLLPYEGDVSVFQSPASKRRGFVAYVPQRPELLYWKTLSANALLGWKIKQHRRNPSDEVLKAAGRMFACFRLADPERKYPRETSGGERQKTALIRALLSSNEIVALDEPVSAIDYIARGQIYEALLNVVTESNSVGLKRTLLIVSHDPEELLYLCDRIITFPEVGVNHIIDVKVPFARPRCIDLKFTAEFVEAKRYLWSLLK
jgi:ABC-type nitrate/sulfonate/bicarbonate transport system ATPase subunit